MATLIPSFSQCGTRMTGGERRFAHRIIDKLEDDYLAWYDVPVGPRTLHPDFVILHPRRGLLILEVKDWKLDIIRRADKHSVTLLTDKGEKSTANPLEQARQNTYAILGQLERDQMLRRPDGDRNVGGLCFPYGYGVVLANISRRAFKATDLGEVIEPGRVICQDEMFEAVDAEAFQERLWNMFTVKFKTVLSLPQVDRIRWHLFPEIRISTEQLPLFEQPGQPQTVADAMPDIIKVLDLQQEQLARNMGEGHRIIHGVAGSGKTLILGYRCEHLAPALAKPVLILCYNVTLAAKLHHWAESKRLLDKVNVRTFHSWCRDQLVLYNVALPESSPAFYDQLVEKVIEGVGTGQIPSAQYGAVMVDEGHDFKPEWLKLVAQMVDPSTNSILILYDDAQSIYGTKSKGKFNFSNLGIQAKGRTTILRLNYRNTREVLSVAYEFAKDAIKPADAEEDAVPLIAPQSAGRRGPLPILRQLTSLKEEASCIAREFKAVNKKGLPWREMAVLYRTRFIGEEMATCLREAGVPVQWVGEAKGGKKGFKPGDDSVKLMTMHSSKGLEFPVVAIPGLGHMPLKDANPTEEARLLYVAMTRAMELLLMTSHKETEFVKRIKQAGAQVAA